MFSQNIYIIISGGKGGVGKSYIAARLAEKFAAYGISTGVIDLDLWGPSQNLLFDSNKHINFNGKIIPHIQNNIRVVSVGSIVEASTSVIWNKETIRSMVDMFFFNVDWGDTRLFLIDCPPGFNEVQMRIDEIIENYYAILVCIDSPLAISDCRRTLYFLRSQRVEILGILENFSFLQCSYCNSSVKIFESNLFVKFSMEEHLIVLGHIPFEKTNSENECFNSIIEGLLPKLKL